MTAAIALGDDELAESFIRAGGPGGQNVNKVATAVQLRFDVTASPSLPGDVKERLIRLAGRRASAAGVIVITAQRYRTQEANRADARARLIDLIARAAEPPAPPRRPTRPSRAVKARRVSAKTRRGALKALRGRPDAE